MVYKLADRVAIVTGGARGLGRAYARRLAALGAKTAICDLDLRSYAEFEAEAKSMIGDSTVAEIEEAGGTALGYELDVTDETAVKAMVDDLIRKWGRIDILVCNAGGGPGTTAETKASSLDPALLQPTIGLNLYGTIHFVNAVSPQMKQQRSGRIVTVSSIAGTTPALDGGLAHYGAAKAAVAQYTRYLAQDLGPFGVTANCIAPGSIATASNIASWAEPGRDPKRDSVERIALRRRGTVEECAKVVEFLCTDMSDYVTGAVIPIDGGLMR
jgi:3-oxoacyl-[acyl-carrier protein] reductase